MKTDGEFQGVKLFVERQMPMLTHLQLCEGLNAIAGDNIESLQNFEKSKMLQIATYQKQCAGQDVSVSQLSKRIDRFIEKLREQNITSAKFEFGQNKDYWPSMEDFHMRKFGEGRIQEAK